MRTKELPDQQSLTGIETLQHPKLRTPGIGKRYNTMIYIHEITKAGTTTNNCLYS